MDEILHIGDRVGIMDEADYRHWSRFGAVTAVPGPGDAQLAPDVYAVQEDGQGGPVPVPANRLARLGPLDSNGLPGEWSVQVFPKDGERPGLPMYFRNSADVLNFIKLFSAAGLSDEKLRVRVPASASDQEVSALKAQTDVELV